MLVDYFIGLGIGAALGWSLQRNRLAAAHENVELWRIRTEEGMKAMVHAAVQIYQQQVRIRELEATCTSIGQDSPTTQDSGPHVSKSE